jgi:hypothetical protein
MRAKAHIGGANKTDAEGGDLCGEGQGEIESEGQSGTEEASEVCCEDEVRKGVQELRCGSVEVLQAAPEKKVILSLKRKNARRSRYAFDRE